MIDVTLPQLGESVTEGTVTKWLVREGDVVAKDQPLLEVATDKADAEVPAPARGRVTGCRWCSTIRSTTKPRTTAARNA